MRVCVLAFTLLFVTPYSDAQIGFAPRPAFFLRGKNWKLLSESTQLMYVYGVEEGRMLTMADAKYACKPCSDWLLDVAGPGNLDISEERAGIDRFFKDPKNDNVPAIEAVEWVNAKAKGATVEELRQLEDGFRQTSKDLPSR